MAEYTELVRNEDMADLIADVHHIYLKLRSRFKYFHLTSNVHSRVVYNLETAVAQCRELSQTLEEAYEHLVS